MIRVFCDHLGSRACIACCLFYTTHCGLLNVKLNVSILTLTNLKQFKPKDAIHPFCYKHNVMISRMTNKKPCKQFPESNSVFHAGGYWRSGWQFSLFIHEYTSAQNNKTNNKATKACLAKPCRRSICSLSWDEHWIHWFVVPERIAEKQHSLRRAVSPACSISNDTLSQVWDFSIRVMCLYWELSAQHTQVCTKALRVREVKDKQPLNTMTEEFITIGEK